MANLTRWNPFDEISRMRDDLSSFLGQNIFSPWGDKGASWGPAVDVKETGSEIIVSAEIPGVNPDDLDMVVSEDSLTIRGEVKQESKTEEKGFYRAERRYGSFQRVIPFPVEVKHEQAAASYNNGVLEVKIPKADPASGKATRLRIQSKDSQQ